LQAQTSVLAHRVLRHVVEAPVRLVERRLSFRDRVTQLVKHQLRERVVVVEHLADADRDAAAPVARRVRSVRAREREADARGGAPPDVVDRRCGERTAISCFHRGHSMRRALPRILPAFIVQLTLQSPNALLREIIRQPSCLTGTSDQILPAPKRVNPRRKKRPCNADFTTRRRS
jgi:hypothetical protein